MDTQDYPGKGLSLSQLVFALNKELGRAMYSPSFTSDQASQLYHDTSVAFAAVCEWKNSFSPINRAPLDILSLIPTHLTRKDRFRATFVCRHWRRTLLQRAELWSELFLSRESARDDVKILLERAKGSALDIHISYWIPENTMALLSPHTTQFRHLCFSYNSWEDIRSFSEVNRGSLPLLHTLEIVVIDRDTGEGSGTTTPLFRNAVDLKVFRFHSESDLQPPLNHFVFPNLTLFDFSAEGLASFRASQLLDFLEMPPVLQTVRMKISGRVFFGNIPQERIVTLPNVKNFDLTLGEGGPNYEIAARISCPSARHTSLKLEGETTNEIEEVFPSSIFWNAIVRQYAASPVEEVALEVKSVDSVTCSLAFRSHDAAAIELGFKVVDVGLFGMLTVDVHNHVLIRGIRAIRDHPQLASVKRLHIYGGFCYTEEETTMEAGQFLLRSMGPLDELTLSYCSLWSFLHPFHDIGIGHTTESIAFPPVKELTIAHPVDLSDSECTAVIGFSMSQHAAGRPFEHVILRGSEQLGGILGGLKPWVGSVEFYLEERHDEEWFGEFEE